jgi:hypothetical protein
MGGQHVSGSLTSGLHRCAGCPSSSWKGGRRADSPQSRHTSIADTRMLTSARYDDPEREVHREH